MANLALDDFGCERLGANLLGRGRLNAYLHGPGVLARDDFDRGRLIALHLDCNNLALDDLVAPLLERKILALEDPESGRLVASLLGRGRLVAPHLDRGVLAP